MAQQEAPQVREGGKLVKRFQDSALRDVLPLVEGGILVGNSAGVIRRFAPL